MIFRWVLDRDVDVVEGKGVMASQVTAYLCVGVLRCWDDECFVVDRPGCVTWCGELFVECGP